MLELIKGQLGINFRNDDLTLSHLLSNYTSVALACSNRENIEGLEPYIIEAVVSHYLRLGDEGLKRTDEAGISYSYTDIQEKMRKDIISNGMRVIR